MSSWAEEKIIQEEMEAHGVVSSEGPPSGRHAASGAPAVPAPASQHDGGILAEGARLSAERLEEFDKQHSEENIDPRLLLHRLRPGSAVSDAGSSASATAVAERKREVARAAVAAAAAAAAAASASEGVGSGSAGRRSCHEAVQATPPSPSQSPAPSSPGGGDAAAAGPHAAPSAAWQAAAVAAAVHAATTAALAGTLLDEGNREWSEEGISPDAFAQPGDSLGTPLPQAAPSQPLHGELEQRQRAPPSCLQPSPAPPNQCLHQQQRLQQQEAEVQLDRRGVARTPSPTPTPSPFRIASQANPAPFSSPMHLPPLPTSAPSPLGMVGAAPPPAPPKIPPPKTDPTMPHTLPPGLPQVPPDQGGAGGDEIPPEIAFTRADTITRLSPFSKQPMYRADTVTHLSPFSQQQQAAAMGVIDSIDSRGSWLSTRDPSSKIPSVFHPSGPSQPGSGAIPAALPLCNPHLEEGIGEGGADEGVCSSGDAPDKAGGPGAGVGTSAGSCSRAGASSVLRRGSGSGSALGSTVGGQEQLWLPGGWRPGCVEGGGSGSSREGQFHAADDGVQPGGAGRVGQGDAADAAGQEQVMEPHVTTPPQASDLAAVPGAGAALLPAVPAVATRPQALTALAIPRAGSTLVPVLPVAGAVPPSSGSASSQQAGVGATQEEEAVQKLPNATRQAIAPLLIVPPLQTPAATGPHPHLHASPATNAATPAVAAAADSAAAPSTPSNLGPTSPAAAAAVSALGPQWMGLPLPAASTFAPPATAAVHALASSLEGASLSRAEQAVQQRIGGAAAHLQHLPEGQGTPASPPLVSHHPSGSAAGLRLPGQSLVRAPVTVAAALAGPTAVPPQGGGLPPGCMAAQPYFIPASATAGTAPLSGSGLQALQAGAAWSAGVQRGTAEQVGSTAQQCAAPPRFEQWVAASAVPAALQSPAPPGHVPPTLSAGVGVAAATRQQGVPGGAPQAPPRGSPTLVTAAALLPPGGGGGWGVSTLGSSPWASPTPDGRVQGWGGAALPLERTQQVQHVTDFSTAGAEASAPMPAALVHPSLLTPSLQGGAAGGGHTASAARQAQQAPPGVPQQLHPAAAARYAIQEPGMGVSVQQVQQGMRMQALQGQHGDLMPAQQGAAPSPSHITSAGTISLQPAAVQQGVSPFVQTQQELLSQQAQQKLLAQQAKQQAQQQAQQQLLAQQHAQEQVQRDLTAKQAQQTQQLLALFQAQQERAAGVVGRDHDIQEAGNVQSGFAGGSPAADATGAHPGGAADAQAGWQSLVGHVDLHQAQQQALAQQAQQQALAQQAQQQALAQQAQQQALAQQAQQQVLAQQAQQLVLAQQAQQERGVQQARQQVQQDAGYLQQTQQHDAQQAQQGLMYQQVLQQAAGQHAQQAQQAQHVMFPGFPSASLALQQQPPAPVLLFPQHVPAVQAPAQHAQQPYANMQHAGQQILVQVPQQAQQTAQQVQQGAWWLGPHAETGMLAGDQRATLGQTQQAQQAYIAQQAQLNGATPGDVVRMSEALQAQQAQQAQLGLKRVQRAQQAQQAGMDALRAQQAQQGLEQLQQERRAQRTTSSSSLGSQIAQHAEHAVQAEQARQASQRAQQAQHRNTTWGSQGAEGTLHSGHSQQAQQGGHGQQAQQQYTQASLEILPSQFGLSSHLASGPIDDLGRGVASWEGAAGGVVHAVHVGHDTHGESDTGGSASTEHNGRLEGGRGEGMAVEAGSEARSWPEVATGGPARFQNLQQIPEHHEARPQLHHHHQQQQQQQLCAAPVIPFMQGAAALPTNPQTNPQIQVQGIVPLAHAAPHPLPQGAVATPHHPSPPTNAPTVVLLPQPSPGTPLSSPLLGARYSSAAWTDSSTPSSSMGLGTHGEGSFISAPAAQQGLVAGRHLASPASRNPVKVLVSSGGQFVRGVPGAKVAGQSGGGTSRYVGGETRLMTIFEDSTISELAAMLSKGERGRRESSSRSFATAGESSPISGGTDADRTPRDRQHVRPCLLRYRLPSEPGLMVDLVDDDDVANMMEEHREEQGQEGPSRQRKLHLFVQWLDVGGKHLSSSAEYSEEMQAASPASPSESSGGKANPQLPEPSAPPNVHPAAPGAAGLQVVPPDDVMLTHFLGSGMYGDTYRGTWAGRPVAVRCLNPTLLEEPYLYRSAWWELVEGVSRQGVPQHDNLVKVYGVVLPLESDPRIQLRSPFPTTAPPFGGSFPAMVSAVSALRQQLPGGVAQPPAVVMELLEGGSLKEALEGGPLGEGGSVREGGLGRLAKVLLALDVARGMAYLHSTGRLHLDLKPSNVVLSWQGDRQLAKVANYALSQHAMHIMGYTPGATTQRSALPWVAPEVVRDPGRVSQKADVYSFGIIMWEIWTCRPPFDDHQFTQLLGSMMRGQDCIRPPCPGEGGEVGQEEPGPGWEKLLRKCWADDPGERPSFSEVARELHSMARLVQQAQRAPSTPRPCTASGAHLDAGESEQKF